MNKLIINTQYLENYGDRDNPYMKFKGGTTYVLPNCGTLDQNQIATLVARVKPFITTDLHESNGGSEEYINSVQVVRSTDQVGPLWDTATEFCFDQFTGDVNFMKVTDNRKDGWMRDEILEQTETWTGDMSATVKRADYKSEYLMEDGDFALGQKGLKEWFTAREVA